MRRAPIEIKFCPEGRGLCPAAALLGRQFSQLRLGQGRVQRNWELEIKVEIKEQQSQAQHLGLSLQVHPEESN